MKAPAATAAIGLKIRERRQRLGITQSELARRLGISASYLNLIERNKRNMAPRLIDALARHLEVDGDWLDGAAETRLIEELRELRTDPVLRSIDLDDAGATDLVSRSPAWAQALVALYRAYLNRSQSVAALSDRLNQDPYLGDAVHTMLTKIASIRSTAEILQQVPDLEDAQRTRFHAVLTSESENLTGIAAGIAQFFDTADSEYSAATPAEEADDFLVERGNYFQELEDAVAPLADAVDPAQPPSETRLADYLAARFGIAVRFVPESDARARPHRNQVRYDADAKRFDIVDSAAVPRYRFQLARLLCALALADTIRALTDASSLLKSDEGRARARGALASYAAAALLMPYARFLEAAQAARYDVEYLARKWGASFEQVCHRLATLKRPGAEGIPFAFMRTDPAGFVTKRMPIPQLPLPRYGNACPLWAVYNTFQAPGSVYRQIVAFPNDERFLFVARALDKRPGRFNEPRHLVSVMIACDVLFADRTIYADGLDLGAAGLAVPVGPSCRLCARTGCAYREEPQIQELRPNRAAE